MRGRVIERGVHAEKGVTVKVRVLEKRYDLMICCSMRVKEKENGQADSRRLFECYG